MFWRIAVPISLICCAAATSASALSHEPEGECLVCAEPFSFGAQRLESPPNYPWYWPVDDVDDATLFMAPETSVVGNPSAPRSAAATPSVPTLRSSAPAPVLTSSTDLQYHSLIHQQREQRTAIAAWGLDSATQVKGFFAEPKRSEDSEAYDHSVKEYYHVQGVVAQHDLKLANSDRISVIGGWVSGNARTGSIDVTNSRRVGSAWSLATNASLLSDQVGVTLEYAGSDSGTLSRSAETASLQSSAARGQAYKAGVEFHTATATFDRLVVGTQYSWIDPQFTSISNPGVVADRETLRTYAGVGLGSLGFDIAVRQERNNLADARDTTTSFKQRAEVATTWKPRDLPLPAWFANPSFKLTANVGEQRYETVADALDTDVDIAQTANLKFESAFQADQVQWGLNAMTGEAPGALDASVAKGIATTQVDLYGDFSVVRGFPAKPVFSWQRLEDRATGSIDEKWRAELRSDSFELRDRLSAELGIGMVQRARTDTDEHDSAFRFGGNLTWTLRPASSVRSGVNVSLSGTYLGGRSEWIAADGEDDFRVMLSLSTTSPLGN